jgi:hypothetical protein
VVDVKARATGASVARFLSGITNERRRRDCKALAAIMREETGHRPKMWGTAIVAFGDLRYKYRSGRTGEWFLCGFSPRASALTLYLLGGYPKDEGTISTLGKIKAGRSCLYLRTLDDVNTMALRAVIAESVRRIRTDRIFYGG